MKSLFSALLLALLLFLAGCAAKNNPVTSTVTPASYTISGTVMNLAGGSSGLVLQNNGADNLSANSNGAFHFTASMTGGTAYNVTVLAQPSNPAQQCAVANGSGTAPQT